MTSIGNPLFVVVGMMVMAWTCLIISRAIPLLDTESRAHASSLPLDGLRGVLASAVFFHHAYITYVFMQTGQWIEPASRFYAQLGPTAVTIFFFISGYLFWGKMLRDPDSLRPARLWPNRLRRIAPAYWTAILLSFLVLAFASHFEVRQSPILLVWHALQWVMFGVPGLVDLNGLSQARTTGGVFWTLRTEMFFYLLLPGLVWFRKSWRVLLIPIVAVMANRGLHLLQIRNENVFCLVDDLERLALALSSGFLVGILAAYRPWSDAIGARLKTKSAAAFGVVLLSIQLFVVPSGYEWYESLLVAPVFLMIVAGNSFFGILTSRSARSLGQISYSVYIFHGILLYASTSIINRYLPIRGMAVPIYWSLILAIGVGVVFFCSVTYWFIERPFLAKAGKPAKVQFVAAQELSPATAGGVLPQLTGENR